MDDYYQILDSDEAKKKQFNDCSSENRTCVFTCFLCAKIFSSVSSLLVHRSVHKTIETPFYPDDGENNASIEGCSNDEKGNFFCDLCSKRFTSVTSLFTHRSVHKTKETPSYSNNGENNMLIGCSRGDKKDIFFCVLCSKRFTSVTSLLTHRSAHETKKTPSYSDNGKNNMSIDCSSGDEKGIFSCVLCSKRFTSMTSLLTHRSIHEIKETPSYSDNGKNNMSIEHSNGDEKGIFSCDLCSHRFMSVTSLLTHRSVHETKKRPLYPDIEECNKTKKHSNTNDRDGLICNFCSKHFSSVSSLLQHRYNSESQGECFLEKVKSINKSGEHPNPDGCSMLSFEHPSADHYNTFFCERPSANDCNTFSSEHPKANDCNTFSSEHPKANDCNTFSCEQQSADDCSIFSCEICLNQFSSISSLETHRSTHVVIEKQPYHKEDNMNFEKKVLIHRIVNIHENKLYLVKVNTKCIKKRVSQERVAENFNKKPDRHNREDNNQSEVSKDGSKDLVAKYPCHLKEDMKFEKKVLIHKIDNIHKKKLYLVKVNTKRKKKRVSQKRVAKNFNKKPDCHNKEDNNQSEVTKDGSKNLVTKYPCDLDDNNQSEESKEGSKDLVAKYPCDFCPERFTAISSLLIHRSFHDSKTDHLSPNRSERLDDCPSKEDESVFSCDMCSRHFKKVTSLMTHRSSHKVQKLYFCNVCDKEFSQKGNMQKHYFTHNPEKAERFCCKTCGKVFTAKWYLKEHESIHSGVKPYECEVCFKRFAVRTNYLKHVLIHSNKEERPLYVCNLCDKLFTTKDYLDKHKLIHTGERPHVCGVCYKAFTLKTNLHKHYAIHTVERPYICNFCDKRFKSTPALKSHLFVHSKVKQFSCKYCPKEFRDRKAHKRHEEKHFLLSKRN